MNPAPPLSATAWLRYDVVKRLLPGGRHRLLEIGAGLGSMGAILAHDYDYTGLEPDGISFETATERVGPHGRVVNSTAEDFVAADPFDVICAFEVLEHVEHDQRALASWLGLLRPGGWFIGSVPAGRHRFGAQDDYVGHYRRYDRGDVRSLLACVGLSDAEVISYGFPLANVLERTRDIVANLRDPAGALTERTDASGRWLQPPPWASSGVRALTYPFRLAQRPFAASELGSGLVFRAQKPL